MEVSVVGTGAMGTAVVERLLATGHDTIIFNRSPGRMLPLEKKGARVAKSARAAVEAAPVTISLVVDAPAMSELILTDEIVPVFVGKTFLKMTTTNGRVAREVNATIEDAGGTCLDIAILNFPDDVSNGKMHAMVGASEADFEAWAPFLANLGPTILRAGEVGAASIAENAMIQIMMFHVVSFAYGLAVFERAKLPQDVLMAATRENPLFQIPLGDYFRDRMIKRDFVPPLYRLVKHTNDMQLTIDDMEDLGIMADGVRSLRELFVRAVAQGLDENDYSAIYNIICPRSGTTEA